MNGPHRCRDCSAEIRPGAPEGLCQRCLISAALAESDFTPSVGQASTAPQSDQLPRRLGDYDILECIAAGGMGVVYKARHRHLGRIAAIKTLPFGRFTRDTYKQRFHAEAVAAARLRHPHIIAIHEVGEFMGQPWFAMDYVDGPSLAELTQHQPLPSARAVRFVHTIAEAVHYAHGMGILHRDLKPSNILIDLRDQPHITDFGLAKDLTGESELTTTGEMLGSPNYIPPEQIHGKRGSANPRTDVYSLGAVLYHLLTGRPPFVGESLTATLQQVASNDAVSPRLLNSSISIDLETICLKCLEKDPGKRYPTAQALADDLQLYLGNRPIIARPITRSARVIRWSQRNPALATSYALLILLALLILTASPLAILRINSARKAALTAAKREAATALRARLNEYAADMFAAGKLAESRNRGSAMSLLPKYVPDSRSGSTDVKPISDSRDWQWHYLANVTRDQSTAVFPWDERTPFAMSLAPDDNRTTDFRGWEWHYLANLTRDDSTAVLRWDDSTAFAMSLSPNGNWIATPGLNGTVKVWDAKNKTLAQRLTVNEVVSPNQIYTVLFSPDGNYLAAGADMAATIHFWDVRTWQKSFVLTNGPNWRVRALAFSGDGRFFAAGLGANYPGSGLVVWDLVNRVPLTRLPWGGFDLHSSLLFSPDSKTLFYDLKDGRLARWNPEISQALPPLRLFEGEIFNVLFSEDGKFATASDPWGKTGAIVWTLPDWKEVYRLTNQAPLAISSRHDRLATSTGQDLNTWQLSTGQTVGTQSGHQAGIHSAAFSPAEPAIVTTSWDNTIRFWPLHPPSPRETVLKAERSEFLKGEDNLVQPPQFSSGGKYWTTIHTNGTFALYSANPLARIRAFPWGVTKIRSADPSPDGRQCAVGGANGELVLLDTTSAGVRATAQFSSNSVYKLRFSPDSSLLAVAHWSENQEWALDVLDAPTLTRKYHLPNSGLTIKALEFTPDNRYLVSGTYSSKAELFDLATGRLIRVFLGHDGAVDSVSVTADARLLATYDSAGARIRLWDARKAEVLAVLHGTAETYSCVALSPDGTRLAAGFEGVDLWDLRTGRHILTASTPGEWCRALAWSTDMSQLVTASDESLRIWPAPTFVTEDHQLTASLRALRQAEATNSLLLLPR